MEKSSVKQQKMKWTLIFFQHQYHFNKTTKSKGEGLHKSYPNCLHGVNNRKRPRMIQGDGVHVKKSSTESVLFQSWNQIASANSFHVSKLHAYSLDAR